MGGPNAVERKPDDGQMMRGRVVKLEWNVVLAVGAPGDRRRIRFLAVPRHKSLELCHVLEKVEVVITISDL